MTYKNDICRKKNIHLELKVSKDTYMKLNEKKAEQKRSMSDITIEMVNRCWDKDLTQLEKKDPVLLRLNVDENTYKKLFTLKGKYVKPVSRILDAMVRECL